MYTGLIITATGVLLVVFLAYLVHRLIAVSTDPLVVLPYQSGWQPTEHVHPIREHSDARGRLGGAVVQHGRQRLRLRDRNG